MTDYKYAAPTALAKKQACRRGGRSYSASAMKKLLGKGQLSGFTLIELLVLICVIAILAAMMLPTSGGPRKAKIINCANNLKILDENFVTWSQTHGGKLPMQVPSKEGGTMDFIQSGSALSHFVVLTNSSRAFVHRDVDTYYQDGTNYQKLNVYTNSGVEPKRFVCPSDEERCRWGFKKTMATTTDTNISYFVGIDATLNNPKSILAGDRHLQIDGLSTKPGLLDLTAKSLVSWTEELHYSKSKKTAGGNILFADGHVEFLKSKPLNSAFHAQDSATNRYAVP